MQREREERGKGEGGRQEGELIVNWIVDAAELSLQCFPGRDHKAGAGKEVGVEARDAKQEREERRGERESLENRSVSLSESRRFNLQPKVQLIVSSCSGHAATCSGHATTSKRQQILVYDNDNHPPLSACPPLPPLVHCTWHYCPLMRWKLRKSAQRSARGRQREKEKYQQGETERERNKLCAH